MVYLKMLSIAIDNDSQIKDDFNCNKECYTDTQYTQQEQQLTPCTHSHDILHNISTT